MELSRLIRVIRGRWAGVLVVAIAGLLVAVMFTNSRNSQRTPEFYATAAVIFAQNSGESGEEMALRLQDAQTEAIDLNREIMVDNTGAAVTFDTDLNELYFSAPGISEDDALNLAREMRDGFLAVETAVNADQLTEQLAAIAAEIGPLEVELAALEEVPDSVALNRSRADYLVRQINAFQQQAINLRLELVPGLSQRDPVVIQTELTAVEQQLESLNLRLLAIPDEDPLTVAQRGLQIKAVSRRIQLLELQYQELYLEQGNLEGRVRIGRATVTDETPAEASVAVSAMLGLIAGMFVSVGGLVLGERARPLVWLQGDVRSLPLLAQVPRKRPGEGAFIWYESAPSEGRKSSLQTFRGAIEGRIGAERTSIAITALSASSAAVQPLAADLAVGIAVSGKSVLLIDAVFEHPSELYEYSSTGPTLSEILSVNPDDPEALLSMIKRALVDTPPVRPGLVSIRPGEGLSDPADALAGQHLRLLLAEAQDVFDLVIVASPEVRTPTGQTLLQRVDYAILSIAPGGASIGMTDSVVDDLARRNVAFLGMVMLPRRRSGRLGDMLGALQSSSPFSQPEVSSNSAASFQQRPTHSPGASRPPAVARPKPIPADVIPAVDPWAEEASAADEPIHIEFVEDTHFDADEDDDDDMEVTDSPRDEDTIDQVLPSEDEDTTDGDSSLDDEADSDQVSLPSDDTDEQSAPATVVHHVVDEEVKSQVLAALAAMSEVPLPGDGLAAAFDGLPAKSAVAGFIEGVEAIDPNEIVELVEASLTNWVVSLVTTPLATHSSNRTSIASYGFMPLFDIRGFSPMRARIRKELDGILGVRVARRFLAALERALIAVASDPTDDRYSINEWVVERFWRRHVEDTDREPTVWHLSSRQGTIQALVEWTRMDRDRIDVFRAEMVRQRIETLRRKAKSASRNGRSDEAASLENQMKDARSLDLALGWLYDGTTPNARIWYPWRPNESPIGWRPNPRQGVKPHLAPLQRLELLAFPVLTHEEMIRLKPTA